jgi:hypothetical protein
MAFMSSKVDLSTLEEMPISLASASPPSMRFMRPRPTLCGVSTVARVQKKGGNTY